MEIDNVFDAEKKLDEWFIHARISNIPEFEYVCDNADYIPNSLTIIHAITFQKV